MQREDLVEAFVSLALQGEFKRIKKTSQLDGVAVEDGSDQLYFSTSGVCLPGSVRFFGFVIPAWRFRR